MTPWRYPPVRGLVRSPLLGERAREGVISNVTPGAPDLWITILVDTMVSRQRGSCAHMAMALLSPPPFDDPAGDGDIFKSTKTIIAYQVLWVPLANPARESRR